MWIAKNNDLIILAKDTREELEQALQFMVYTSIVETDIEYVLFEGKYITKTEKEEIERQREQERIASLSMTRSDFFDGFILAFGLGQAELRVIVEQILNSINITDIEIKVALNNYDNALNFYRKHTLFTLLSGVEIPISETIILKFTSEIWDKFFDETNKRNPLAYQELQKSIQPIPEPTPEPTEEPLLNSSDEIEG